jgi:RTX calcium-binding nonapeptide repeat (4 copies)
MPSPSNRTIFGDDTANTLNGTDAGEAIYGFGNNDLISAWEGNDEVFGGIGNDVLNGGRGNDSLFGEAGNDTLVGEDGNDELSGGEGNDLLLGGRGNDDLDGGAGSDKFMIARGDGVDTIKNFTAEDRIDLGAFNFASAQTVIDAFRQQGPNAVLDFGQGDRLILKDTKVTDLSSDQFNVSPYLVPMDTNAATPAIDSKVSFTPLLTVGDHVGNYAMAGIPDGLGAFDNGDGTFTVLMNHELNADQGAVHAHGAQGAFVSEWVFDKTTLQVLSGQDLMQHVWTYDSTSKDYVDHSAALGNGIAFSRFCSADLPDQGAFYNAATGLGYNGGQLYLNGEESGVEGRSMAHIASGPDAGNSYELAWLGNMAYENVVANPNTGDKTVVGMMDDGQNGQVYFYFGDKKAAGNAVEQAGLTGGHLFGIKVEDFAGNNNNASNSTSPLGADQMSKFSLVDLGDVSGMTGAQIDQASESAGVASFLRPEDGAWDTISANRFYFVTTNAFDQPSQLWAVDFADASNPAAGGTIKLLLDGSEGQQMLDNITVNEDGKLILCEDVGNNAHIGKVWEYDPLADSLIPVAQHDPARFAPGGDFFLTQDEESSGVLDISDILGSESQNAYLIDVQAHFDLGGSLVQGGQLLVMQQDLL